MKSPHPNWSTTDWAIQAREVGFETDEEYEYWMYLRSLDERDKAHWDRKLGGETD